MPPFFLLLLFKAHPLVLPVRSFDLIKHLLHQLIHLFLQLRIVDRMQLLRISLLIIDGFRYRNAERLVWNLKHLVMVCIASAINQLGIIEIFSKAYISTQFSDAIVFAVLIIVLLIKPAGLLGKKIHEKV